MPSQDSPLKVQLEATWKHPEALRLAGEHVTDAVELAWAAARTLFGKQAKPQHAIELARLFLEQAGQHTPAGKPVSPRSVNPEGPPLAPTPKARKASSPSAKAAATARDGRDEVPPSVPPLSKKTAANEEPPRAVSKAGRPARM